MKQIYKDILLLREKSQQNSETSINFIRKINSNTHKINKRKEPFPLERITFPSVK
jgi:hypothetical protein